MGAVMHKICNIIYAMLRDNKPFEVITPEEHCRRFDALSQSESRITNTAFPIFSSRPIQYIGMVC